MFSVLQIWENFTGLDPDLIQKLNKKKSASDYMGLLVDYCLLNIYAAFQVKETGQKRNGQDRFSLSKHELTFNMSDKLIAGNDETVHMFFTNPLAVSLTNCKLMLKCSGTVWPMIEKVEDVGTGEVFNHTMIIKARKQRWGS